MRGYDLILLIDSDLSSEEKKSQLEKIERVIRGEGGKIEKTEGLGKRKLAYPIRKKETGDYFLWEIQLPEASLKEVNQKLKIEEGLLRYLIVRKIFKKRQLKSKTQSKGGK